MSTPHDADPAGGAARPGVPDAGERLLAVSEELSGPDHEPGWRSRSGTVRRRTRVVRGPGGPESVAPEGDERARVRSVAQEGVAPGDPAAAPAPERPAMLDAMGQPIADTAATAAAAAAAAVTGAGAAEPGRYLADAVRRYLDGLDRLGADHEVTRDRLEQVRRTLDRYDPTP